MTELARLSISLNKNKDSMSVIKLQSLIFIMSPTVFQSYVLLPI